MPSMVMNLMMMKIILLILVLNTNLRDSSAFSQWSYHTRPHPSLQSIAVNIRTTGTNLDNNNNNHHHKVPMQARGGAGGTYQQMVSSGFSFNDGEQILVSAQKPWGITLVQNPDTGTIFVVDMDFNGSAGKAGVQVGDVLVAIQNASTENVDLDSVLEFIKNGPRVMNLRFVREEVCVEKTCSPLETQ
jgi:predicted metalloprotease with PDZ domain